MALLGFGMGIILDNLHVCGMMLLFNVTLNMLIRYASPRGPMYFRCIMFNLSVPVELLFCHVYCLFDLSCCLCIGLCVYLLVLCVCILFCSEFPTYLFSWRLYVYS